MQKDRSREHDDEATDFRDDALPTLAIPILK